MNILSFIKNCIGFLITCLIRGVLIIVPFILTFYVISKLIKWGNTVLGLGMPVSGVIIILVFILFCGYFAKSFIIQFFYDVVEFTVGKIPGVNFLYSSVKDFTFAFIDKKVKFDQPVLVCINVAVEKKNDIKKIGFITNENLDSLGINDHVSVFVPQSFSFSLSGEFLLIPKKNLIPIKDVDGPNVMRFVVAAGFIDNEKKKV